MIKGIRLSAGCVLPLSLMRKTGKRRDLLVSVIGRKILLVEDNELNMEIAEFILRKEGMDVIRAWNGKEALERLKHLHRERYL